MDEVIFVPISNPRQGKGFGPHRCTRCGADSGGFLGITVGEYYIELCKGCLVEGEQLINKTILSQYHD